MTNEYNILKLTALKRSTKVLISRAFSVYHHLEIFIKCINCVYFLLKL